MFAPTGLEGAALIGYAFATQVLFRTMYGLVNIPYSALMATMTRDSMQRNWLAGARMICAFLGTASSAISRRGSVTYFTSGGRTTGYFRRDRGARGDRNGVHDRDVPHDARRLLDRARQGAAAAGQRAAAHVAKNVPFLQIIAGIGFFSFREHAGVLGTRVLREVLPRRDRSDRRRSGQPDADHDHSDDPAVDVRAR
jgi:GPH family glycoside/pentoside/hexuronide:cation symporter